MTFRSTLAPLMASTAIAAMFPVAALAQDQDATAASDQTSAASDVESTDDTTTGDEASRSANALMDVIIVTAEKKSRGQEIQDVPISITAFGEDQLDALQFQDIESLTYSMPSVQFDDLGSQKGVANFTVRGLGVNSSTPSIEPAVGTFIDGVYLGSNFGVVLDMFEVESVEVLRGPQGVLFGRNVTGGAVALRTARPDGDFGMHLRATAETGLNAILAGSIEGAVVPDVLNAKLVAYLNKDYGYFKNTFTGREDGQNDTFFIRPTLVFQPTDTLDITVIGQYYKLTGDGPISRNPLYQADPEDFTVSADDPGFTDLRVRSATVEANWYIGPGDGVLTNIFGYRDLRQRTGFDLDSQSQHNAFLKYFTDEHQYSNELRYAVTLWDKVDFVIGGFYFDRTIKTVERDELYYLDALFPPEALAQGGGNQYQTSKAVFANADIRVTDRLTLGVGGRYSEDDKDVEIEPRTLTTTTCDFEAGVCSNYSIQRGAKFTSFTPRIMAKYEIGNNAQVYASYTKGYRSGGFNIRSNSVGGTAPFGDENTNSYEVGFKGDFFGRMLRLNTAAFYNEVSDLQRDANFQTATGQLSLVTNAADARIWGFEAEATAEVARNFVLKGSVGYVNGKYTDVFTDINFDGVVDGADLALKIPRLAPWTWNVGAFKGFDLGTIGTLDAQVTLDYRDGSFFNDANTGPLPSVYNLGASIAYSPASFEYMTITLYGKNLLDEYNTGNATPLAANQGGGFIHFPKKGRVIGIELDVDF